jgi:Domain of unknown function (DUF4352)
MLAVGCTGSNDEKSAGQMQNNSVPSNNIAPNSHGAESSFKIYKIGETASDNLTKITVNGERYADSVNEKNDEYFKAPKEEGYNYLILNLTLENISPTHSRTYAFMQYKILNPDGSTYQLDDNATMALSKQIDVADVTPGSMRRGEIAFKVPSNSTGLQFEFIYDPLSSAEAVVFNL